MYSFRNLNQILIGMSRVILNNGVWRRVRGFDCLEIPHPVTIELTNPSNRYITISKRKWNPFLPWAESLWMALGLNDLNSLPGRYVKNLYTYSDNGRTWRGGYGPRLRAYSGNATDYDISEPQYRHIFSGYVKLIDQLRYVIEALQRDLSTRQAIIQFGDPPKDCFDENNILKETKDFPCSRVLQFMVVDGKLNLTLYIRSNDILYGLSAVNITNFTLMQEYVANIIGIPVGKYYHIVNNLHLYKEHKEKIHQFADLRLTDHVNELQWYYKDRFKSLDDFDNQINRLYEYEKKVYSGECEDIIKFDNDMIDDWALIFLKFKKLHIDAEFNNPYLNLLF